MTEKMRIVMNSYKEALEMIERQKERFDAVELDSTVIEGWKKPVVVCKDN